MTIVDELAPTTYELLRVGLQLDADNNLVALADMAIRNEAGQVLTHDHPQTALTTAQRLAFKTWLLAQLANYETATGLERYVPPVREAPSGG